MANWNTLKTAVADIINTNGNQAITGQLLQNVLNNIITNVGENATFAGIATLDTNPGAPDGPVFYLTATAGTYPNFNGVEVQDGEAVILLWNNNAWSKKVTGFATQEKLSQVVSKLELPLKPVNSPFIKKSGKAISEDGSIVSNDNYTNFELTPNYEVNYIEYYSRVLGSGLLNFACYDANGNFISGERSTVNNIYVRKYIPENISLIIVSVVSAYVQDVPARVVYNVNEALDKVVEITNDLFVEINDVNDKVNLTEKIIQVNTGNTDVSLLGYTVSDVEWEVGAINGVTGAEMSTSNAIQRTPFINIEGFEKVFVDGIIRNAASNYGYAFYDAEYNYIGGSAFEMDSSATEHSQKDYATEIPNNAVYFRTCRFVSVQPSWYMIIAKGESLKEYIGSELNNVKKNFIEVESKFVELDAKIGDVQVDTQEYTISSIEWEVGAINGVTGAEMSTSNAIQRTPFIGVEGFEKVFFDGIIRKSSTASNYGYAFYDAEYSYIGGSAFERSDSATEHIQKDYTAEIPDNAVYFRTSRFVSVEPDWFMIVQRGSSLKEELDKLNKSIGNGIGADSPFFKGQLSTFKPNFAGWYECQEKVFAENFTTRILNTSYNELVDYYDGMMADAPNYMTKKNIGVGSGVDTNGNEYHLCVYSLKPKRKSEYTNKNHPKILIDSSMHGSERQCAFGLYYFIKDLIYNYNSNPILYYLRNFVEIQFVPITNPWGFDNDSYTNANGINLNRNFPHDKWVVVTEPEGQATGLEPLDQPESKAIDAWIKENKDVLCYINMHTNGVRAAAQTFHDCNALMSDFSIEDSYFRRLNDVIANHIEDQSARFELQYDNVVLGEGFVGKFQLTTKIGTITSYNVMKLNNIALTFEEFGSIKDADGNIIVDADSNQAKTICAEMLGNFIAKLLMEYSE